MFIFVFRYLFVCRYKLFFKVIFTFCSHLIMMLRSGQARSQSRSQSQVSVKSKNNDKNKSANVSNKSQSATNDRLVKSAIPASKTLSPLGKPRKEGSSPMLSFLNNSTPTVITNINIPQRLSLPYKPLFSPENAVIQDLIKLNQELVNRVQVLEKELELSKRKFSDVSDKDPDVVVEDAPAASPNSTFTETFIDRIQPPPLIDISSVTSTPSSPKIPMRDTSFSTGQNSNPRLLIVWHVVSLKVCILLYLIFQFQVIFILVLLLKLFYLMYLI